MWTSRVNQQTRSCAWDMMCRDVSQEGMGIGEALTKTQRKSWNFTWASKDGSRKGRLGPDNGKEGQN